MGEVPWGWICALSTSGPGEVRPGFMQISCEEAKDWLAWGGGAGRAHGSGPTGARSGTGAVQARPLDHRPSCRSFSQAMPPLWVVLALGCLRLGSGKRRMRRGWGAGLCPPWTGRVLRPPILLKGPERHLDGNLTYSPQE